jgi:glutamate-1-semialdehyde 2,1-aminomutase
MRLARAFTGRDRIVKFEGQYHGVHDYALVSPDEATELGDRADPIRIVRGRGIPEVIATTMIPVPFNDLDALRRVFERDGEQIAAVIVEPILGNAQALLPQPGFLEGVRALTSAFGALLIFDEVKTGFRVARGGAAELFGVTPDLATYAKACGNGYPVAAFGGRRDVMNVLPDHVSHGGTYAGNRVAAAAASKTLSIIRDTDALATIDATGRRIQAGVHEVLNERGLAHVFTGVPAMFGIIFGDAMPPDYRAWAAMDHDLYDTLAKAMIERGVMPEPDFREPWFLSEAHASTDIIDTVVTTFESALGAALDERGATSDRAAGRRPSA